MGFFKSLFKKKPTQANRLGHSIQEAGNVFMMLFGAVGMVGVIGASTMTVMKGPVKTMSQVTQRTIAENNMIAAGKLALISGKNNDCDADDVAEPIPFVTVTGGITGGGGIPPSIGVAKQDPWGKDYGYCVWDHGDGDSLNPDSGDGDDDNGTCGSDTNYRSGTVSGTEYVLAIVSAGPDKQFNTSCLDFVATGTPILNKTGGSDDIVLGYTSAEAGTIAGGLWDADGTTGAEISRNLTVTNETDTFDAFTLNSATGDLALGAGATGSFPSVNTDNLSSNLAANITVLSPMVSDSLISTTGNINANEDAFFGDAITDTVSIAGVTTIGNGLTVTGTTGLGATTVTSLDAGSGAITTTGALNAGASTLGATGVSTLSSGGTITAGGNILMGGNFLSNDGGSEGLSIDTSGNLTGSADIAATSALSGGSISTTGTLSADGNVTLGDAGTDTLTINGTTSMAGVLDMNSQVITGVGDPGADNTAAVNKGTMDAAIASAVGAVSGNNETDPQVGDVTTDNNWCIANGGKVECTEAAPTFSETDPQVGTLTNGRWCTTDGTDIDCTTPAPVDTDTLATLSCSSGQVAEWTGSAWACIDKFASSSTCTISSLAQESTFSNSNTSGAHGVTISGNYAYVVSVSVDRLTVIDISNPASPTQVGTISSADLDSPFEVAVSGNYAYVASFNSDSLTIIDISNPASPTQVGTISNANLNGARDVVVSGNYAYVTANITDSLTVIDVSNPASPTQVGTISSADLNDTRGLTVSGNYAYVTANAADSLTVIDISNPASPTQVGTISNANLDGAHDVAILNNYAYVASRFSDSVTVIDVSNPASPTQVGTISNTDLEGALNIAVSNNYAYVASGFASSLTIIDTGCDPSAGNGPLIASAGKIVDADNDTQIQVEEGADDDTIRFDTAGTERMVIADDGAVGIGDTSPDGTLQLDVEGQVGSTGYCDENGANCTTAAAIAAAVSGGDDLGDHSATQLLDMNGFIIRELADPTGAQHAATKAYVDAAVVAGADDLGNHTATTALNLATNKITNLGTPTLATDAATKAYVDAAISLTGDDLGDHSATQLLDMNGFLITEVADPTAAQHAATKSYVDAAVVAGADDLGNHIATTALNLSTNKITNLGAPTVATDATNKSYVDTAIGALTDNDTVGDLSCSAGNIAKFNGTIWACAADAGASGGDNLGDHTASQDIDAATNKIINLGAPTNDNDGATKKYIDDSLGALTDNDTLAALSCTDGQVVKWNNTGSVWECAADASGSGGDDLGNHAATQLLDMNGFVIREVADPTAAQHAATKAYVDAAIVAAPGDDLGDHTATTALDLATNKITNLGTPTAPTDATTKGYVDTAVAAAADNLGNHSAGQILDMNGFIIREVADPTAAQHAATKAYVDGEIGGIVDSDTVGALSCSAGNIAKFNGTVWACAADAGASGGDNLGDHTASQNIDAAANKIINLADPTLAQDATTKTYVDTAIAAVPGDDLGDHTATTALDLASNKITNLGAPTLANDATTKTYVDVAVAAAADNLGNHTATTTLNMSSNAMTAVSRISFSAVTGSAPTK